MYLRINRSRKTGRVHLSAVQGYRDAEGKSRQKTIQTFGYVDVLESEYEDPIAHFKKVVDEMDKERILNETLTLVVKRNKQLKRNVIHRKNYGYLVYSKIYHELEIDRFLKNAQRHKNFKYNAEAIMRLLLYTRLLYPGSKRASHLKKDLFFCI